MKFQNKILIFLTVAVWFVPVLANSSVPAQPTYEQTRPFIAGVDPRVVTVSQAESVSTVSVSAMPVSAACDLVTDQSTLLNQPANCFNLAVTQLAPQPDLDVTRFESAVTVAVATPVTSFLPNQVAPAVPDPYLPALPLPMVGLLLGATIFSLSVSLARRTIRPVTAQYRVALSLSQLQLFRC